MLVKKFRTAKASLVGVWKIEESEEELLSLCELSPSDFAKFRSFTSKRRRIEFLAVRCLLKTLGCNFQIQYSDRKPIIENGYISISHSANMAAVIVNPSIVVGIDIEQKRENIFRVADRVFSENEILQTDGKIELLTILWNSKECVYKMISVDDIDFREQMQIDISDLENIRCSLNYTNKEETIIAKSLVVEDNLMVFGER